MKIFGLMLLKLILAMLEISASCEESTQVESNCKGCYLNLIRNHTKRFRKKIDYFRRKSDALAKLESVKQLLQTNFEIFEQKMNNFSVINESTAQFKSIEQLLQEKFDLLERKINLHNENIIETKKCNVHMQYTKIGSKYYYIENIYQCNWFAAAHKCRALGGNLATLRNDVEFNALLPYLRNGFNYWFDMNDLSTEGTFLSLTTGEELTYFNWHLNEPSNFQNNEHCGDLWYKNGKHRMNDANCNSNNFFICEFP